MCARACACACNVRVRFCSFLCLCSFVCVCAACVRACPCMRAIVSARECSCVSIGLHLHAHVCSERVRAPRGCMRPPIARWRLAVSIARPRRALRPRARGYARCHRPQPRASAAGITWTSRTLKAPWWGARSDHTSVIDAAGAIYVIGGSSDNGTATSPVFQDVWVSPDGGARPDSVQGMVGGYSRGYSGRTKG